MEHSKLLLLVDDDPRNIYAMELALRIKGFRSISCGSGLDALQLLQRHPEIHLVLLDMMMPEMDGYETIAKIRAQPALATLPIVAVTAQAMSGDREKCLSAGANDYLSKPVDLDRLLQIIEKHA